MILSNKRITKVLIRLRMLVCAFVVRKPRGPINYSVNLMTFLSSHVFEQFLEHIFQQLMENPLSLLRNMPIKTNMVLSLNLEFYNKHNQLRSTNK